MARKRQKENPKAKESAIYSARCRWHRYWSHRDLCGRARGTRHSPGEEVRHIYRGLARLGRLARCLFNQNGGHGIHRSLLDRSFPDPGAPGFGSLPGQRPPCQRGAGAQNRHPGLPVAAIPPHGGIAARFLPACGSRLCASQHLAPSRHPAQELPRARCCSCKRPSPR